MNAFLCTSLALLLTVSQRVAAAKSSKSRPKAKGKSKLAIGIIIAIIVVVVIGTCAPRRRNVHNFLQGLPAHRPSRLRTGRFLSLQVSSREEEGHRPIIRIVERLQKGGRHRRPQPPGQPGGFSTPS